jgi:hypothetical protein
LIPTPILTVLSTFRKNGVQTLLMGGQACVFYGAAQVSKDIDLALLAEQENIDRLRLALQELDARRIAVPPFDPALFERGHAIHFRCHREDVAGLRVDLMSKLRLLDSFSGLWERRTTFAAEDGSEFNLLSVPDLVRSKKTARNKDWPVIELLVNIHIHENLENPTADWIRFWLAECRTPVQLIALAVRFSAVCRGLSGARPLLELALAGNQTALLSALDVEMRAEQAVDRAYWEPVRRELEAMRLDEARKKQRFKEAPGGQSKP